jgi:hypothetical protein
MKVYPYPTKVRQTKQQIYHIKIQKKKRERERERSIFGNDDEVFS